MNSNSNFIDTIVAAKVVRDVNNWWWEMKVEVSTAPSGIDFVYTVKEDEARGTSYYYGTCSEYVSALAHTPSNQNGFGGTVFSLRMAAGEIVDIKGPWTGRPAIYMAAGFPAYMEVTLVNAQNTLYGITKQGVDAILAKFDLPFHTEIGPMYKGSSEDALILVANDANHKGVIESEIRYSGIPDIIQITNTSKEDTMNKTLDTAGLIKFVATHPMSDDNAAVVHDDHMANCWGDLTDDPIEGTYLLSKEYNYVYCQGYWVSLGFGPIGNLRYDDDEHDWTTANAALKNYIIANTTDPDYTEEDTMNTNRTQMTDDEGFPIYEARFTHCDNLGEPIISRTIRFSYDTTSDIDDIALWEYVAHVGVSYADLRSEMEDGTLTIEYNLVYTTNNTTEKETTMSTTHPCVGVNKGNGAQCGVHSTDKTALVLWKGSTAYPISNFPPELTDLGTNTWSEVNIPVCGNHLRQLTAGKAIRVNYTMTKEFVANQIEEMIDMISNSHVVDDSQREVNIQALEAFAQELETTAVEEHKPHVASRIKCGTCGRIHFSVEEVKECAANPTTKPVKQILCGNCRKNGVENPYHSTTDEVKACYQHGRG